MNKIDTRTSIIKAAERIILEEGFKKLTLDQVAKNANVSKGGLLYHFPSKNALITGMLEYALNAFDIFIESYTKNDTEAGSWARGYILGAFPPAVSHTAHESASASALVASSGLNPKLLKPYIEKQKNWIPALIEAGLDETTAYTIRLAVDGLWLNEALGINPLDENQKIKFIQYLIKLTKI